MRPHTEAYMTKTYGGTSHQDNALGDKLSELGGAGCHNRPRPKREVKPTGTFHGSQVLAFQKPTFNTLLAPARVLIRTLNIEHTKSSSPPPVRDTRPHRSTTTSKQTASTSPKCHSCGLVGTPSHHDPPLCLCGIHRCIDLTSEVFCPDIEAPMDGSMCCHGHAIQQQQLPHRRHSGLSTPPMLADEDEKHVAVVQSGEIPPQQPTPSDARRISWRQHRLEQARHELLFGDAHVDQVYAHSLTEKLRNHEEHPSQALMLPTAEMPVQEQADKTEAPEEGSGWGERSPGPEHDNFPRWMDTSRFC